MQVFFCRQIACSCKDSKYILGSTGLNIDVVVRFVLHLVLNCETENILKTNITMEEFLILINSFYSSVG